MSLHEFLKRATAGHHQAVESAVHSSRILRPDFTRSEYLNHLSLLCRGHHRAAAMLLPQQRALAAAGFGWPEPPA